MFSAMRLNYAISHDDGFAFGCGPEQPIRRTVGREECIPRQQTGLGFILFQCGHGGEFTARDFADEIPEQAVFGPG
ncbi:MAG TPA: hypothetical protein VGO40_13755, partial [Longimicrobium sp.]|nr:hypothetical protein [Longimicrobium sp.]